MTACCHFADDSNVDTQWIRFLVYDPLWTHCIFAPYAHWGYIIDFMVLRVWCIGMNIASAAGCLVTAYSRPMRTSLRGASDSVPQIDVGLLYMAWPTCDCLPPCNYMSCRCFRPHWELVFGNELINVKELLSTLIKFSKHLFHSCDAWDGNRRVGNKAWTNRLVVTIAKLTYGKKMLGLY